jgi:Ca2+-binding RTX toxin-like protein
VNTVTVSYASRVFTVTDTTAVITAASGCSSVTEHQVTCDAHNGFLESSVSFVIVVEDLNDSVSIINSPISFGVFNQISGGDGNDVLTGGPANEAITGGEGNDTLSGGLGNDHLDDGPGDDTVNGEAGDDTLISREGADFLMGGSGTDLVTYYAHVPDVTVTIDGQSNDGNAVDGPAGARDNVASDVESLQGSTGPDELTGGPGNDNLDGYVGNDTLNGVGGADTLYGDSGDDTLNGGSGDDFLQGGGPGGADVMNGGTDVDTVDYSDHIWMDTVVTVTLDGVADDGFLLEHDNAGPDVENIVGTQFGDILTGNASNNSFLGGGGNDTLNGLGGDDNLDGGIGADVLSGGSGSDVADYSDRTKPVAVLLDGTANDGESGEGDNVGTDVEDVFGGSGDDTLIGNAQANVHRQ